MSQPITATAITPGTAITIRHDGWTPERKARFLDHLASAGNVRAACARAGMSPEAAYRLRRRDALFARAWAAALVLASEASAEVLATRAIDGVEEEIYFRGELVGTRRRYDSRLLLAHMARLDRLAGTGAGRKDAARFDYLLAAIAEVECPDDLVDGDEPLPLDRTAYAMRAAEQAELAARHAERGAADDEDEDEADDCGEDYEEDYDAFARDHDTEEANEDFARSCAETADRAHAEALARWDGWLSNACATLDGMMGAGAPVSSYEPSAAASKPPPCTVSDMSTSPQLAAQPNPLHRSFARA